MRGAPPTAAPTMTNRRAAPTAAPTRGGSPGADRESQRRTGGGGGRHARGGRPVHPVEEGGRQLHGALPLPRRKDALVFGQSGREALLLLRLRRRRRPAVVRRKEGEPRLRPGRRSARPVSYTHL